MSVYRRKVHELTDLARKSLRELVDLEAEKKRLTEEAAKTDAEIARAEGMLSNSAFVSKAPAAVVGSEKEKLEKLRIKRKALAEALEKL